MNGDEKIRKKKGQIVEQFPHGVKWTEPLLIIFDSSFPAPSQSIFLEIVPAKIMWEWEN
jgi:hypothetical protein